MHFWGGFGKEKLKFSMGRPREQRLLEE